MKKSVFMLGIIIIICSLSGCQNKEMEESNETSGEAFYYGLESVESFTTDGEDIIVSHQGQPIIERYNELGEKIEEIDFGVGNHTNLVVVKDDILAFTYSENGLKITEYSKKDKKVEQHSLPFQSGGGLSMAATESKIYLIYWNDENIAEDAEEDMWNDSDYTYMGEQAVVIDRESYEITELPIKNVIALYQVSQEKLIYYAYDENQGYYFMDYDCETEQFGKKEYNSLYGYTFGFAVNEDEDRVITADFGGQKLISGQIENQQVKAEILSGVGVASGNDIKIENENCYVRDSITNDIIRVVYNEHLVENEPITFLKTISIEEPYGCGYSIETKQLEAEEFALNVMAGNSDYDLCMLDSSEETAIEIRDKGAYYPLNDVPGVKQYLEACYPYVEEAATENDGTVWMIPIAVDIPFIMYNDKTCQNVGIDGDEIDSYEKLLETAELLYQNENTRNWYSLNGYQLQMYILEQFNELYIKKNLQIEYNTKEFQKLCELLKEAKIGQEGCLSTWLPLVSEYALEEETYYDNLILAMSHYYELNGFGEIQHSKLRASKLPAITENAGNMGTCVYLSVNPNSEHLEDTLTYISAYCKYLLKKSESLYFKEAKNRECTDSELTQDLNRIYENGVICFELPDEIFWEDYFDYQDGVISFEEMTEELNRKVQMYLNE